MIDMARFETETSQAERAQRALWPRFALAYALTLSAASVAAWFVRPSVFVQAPAIVLLFVALSVALAFACGGQAFVHQRFSGHDFVQHNEVGGFIIAVAGTVYAVVLGFITVVAWQHFADARQLVAMESAAATDVWHAAVGLPERARSRVRRDALEYSTSMVAREWPKMRTGRVDTKPDLIIMDAITASGTFKPADMMQSNSQVTTLQQLGVLHDARLRRLSENSAGIAGFEWLVLLIGAVCVISFCWLFGLANMRVHLVMTAAVTVLTTSLLVLLFELQYPFRTDLRIEPDSWTAAISHIHTMQSGTQMEMRM